MRKYLTSLVKNVIFKLARRSLAIGLVGPHVAMALLNNFTSLYPVFCFYEREREIDRERERERERNGWNQLDASPERNHVNILTTN